MSAVRKYRKFITKHFGSTVIPFLILSSPLLFHDNLLNLSRASKIKKIIKCLPEIIIVMMQWCMWVNNQFYYNSQPIHNITQQTVEIVFSISHINILEYIMNIAYISFMCLPSFLCHPTNCFISSLWFLLLLLPCKPLIEIKTIYILKEF